MPVYIIAGCVVKALAVGDHGSFPHLSISTSSFERSTILQTFKISIKR